MSCAHSQVKQSLKLLMGSVHGRVTAACHEYFEKYRRHVYVTPKSYLSFLAGYRQLYEKKLAHVRGMAQSIAAGLAKMNEAKVDVNRMKVRAQPLIVFMLVCLHYLQTLCTASSAT